MGEKLSLNPISLFHWCEYMVYKVVHKPPRKQWLVWRCYSLGCPNYPNELMIVCIGDINYELMASLFEDRYRLE